jgi:SAM-dependent methyltransferase
METILTASRAAAPRLYIQTWRRRKFEKAKQLARAVVRPAERRHVAVRRRLAAQHLAGSGIEIGALHIPLRVPRSVAVRYVDRLELPELRAHYPELDRYDLVEPNIIDDGEQLSTVADCSVDFVIANHMIEHCENPIGTLMNFLRVLRTNGTIYMAVPDRRLTFDRDRPLTEFSHLARDYTEGPGWSRTQHYEEWAHFVSCVPEHEVSAHAQDLERDGYSIHFHVWTPITFLEFLLAARSKFELPLDLDAVERNDHEFIVIMRRAAD